MPSRVRSSHAEQAELRAITRDVRNFPRSEHIEERDQDQCVAFALTSTQPKGITMKTYHPHLRRALQVLAASLMPLATACMTGVPEAGNGRQPDGGAEILMDKDGATNVALGGTATQFLAVRLVRSSGVLAESAR